MKYYKMLDSNSNFVGLTPFIGVMEGVVYQEITEEEYHRLEQINENRWKEMAELRDWFEGYYAQHEQKYNRLIALGKLTDDGQNPEDVRRQLYLDAEVKRKRIQALENLNII